MTNARMQGISAAHDDRETGDTTQNPYEKGTEEHKQWEQGYAYFESLVDNVPKSKW